MTAPAGRPSDDELLARPGCIRAFWWSVCRGCEHRIEERDVMVLAPVDGHNRWVCVPCGLERLRADPPPGW